MTMYVPAPENESIRITNNLGFAMMDIEPPRLEDGTKNPSAGKEREARRSYQEFLLERTKDPKFFSHSPAKEGLQALELLKLARDQIKATRGKTGVHAFDNDVAERLQAAILKPEGGHLGSLEYEHNWIEWGLLWKKLDDKPPAVMVLPEPPQADSYERPPTTHYKEAGAQQ
jgi:hypothetical protein